MLKVTITLPSGATVTLETTEPDRYGEIISSAREYLSPEPSHDRNGLENLTVTTGEPPTSRNGQEDHGAAADEARANGNSQFLTDDRFLEFCQDLDPISDMRRVVVAAEGARRFLDMKHVSAQELETLFDFVQWPKPTNFVQTLRNAGRSNFRWLQRIPGRSGYYSVTDQGLREIIPETADTSATAG